MKLLTKELEKRFKAVGRQEGNENPIVVAKFFNPTGASTWYATEYNPDDKLFYGYAVLFSDDDPCNEWGYFSLEELESIKGMFGLGIEQDQYTGEKKISEYNINSLKQ